MQPGQPSERRRLMDLEDAPELDSSDEAALDAIRRQLDEEFGRAEAVPEVADPPEDRGRIIARPEPDGRRRERSSPLRTEPRPRPEPEPWTRPAPVTEKRTRADREAMPRPAPDAEMRARPGPARDPRERAHPAWARPERFRDERLVQPASRIVREPAERLAVQRFPSRWRESESPPSPEPRSRRGLFVAIGLTAGLAGGAAGAVLTVLLLTGDRGDPLQTSWGKVVAAARDSGLIEAAAAVKDRALSVDPWDLGRDETVRPRATPPREAASRAPSSTPRRVPVTTSEIPDPVHQSAGTTGSRELRDLVAAGRDAYVRRDYATAELLFARAVERSLSDGLLRYHHAIALMGLGRFAEARTEFGYALRLGVEPAVAEEARQALAQLNAGRRRR